MTTSTTTASPQHCCTGCDRFPEEWTLQANGLGLYENDIDDSVLMKRSHTDPNCWEGMGVFSCGDAYQISVCCNEDDDEEEKGITMAAQMCAGPVELDCEVRNADFTAEVPEFDYLCWSDDVSSCDCCPGGPGGGGLGTTHEPVTTAPPVTTTPWPPGDCGCLPSAFEQPIWLCNKSVLKNMFPRVNIGVA